MAMQKQNLIARNYHVTDR